MPRDRPSRIAGAIAFLFSIGTVIVFILFILSTSVLSSLGLAVLSIISAVLNACACMLILRFTLFPHQHPYAFVPSLIAGLTSACAMGWMWIRQQDLIIREHPKPMMLAGFAVYIVAIVTQSVFWTILPSTTPRDLESNLPTTTATTTTTPSTKSTAICQCAETTYEITPPQQSTFSSRYSLSLSARDSKHRIFATQFHHLSKPRNSFSTRASEDTDRPNNSLRRSSETPEVNHFDDWETSDVSARERVLAVIEQEAMEEEDDDDDLTAVCPFPESSIYSNDEVDSPERQNSPPLPLSPRNRTFPMPVYPVTARYTFRGAAGRWPARSRKMDSNSGTTERTPVTNTRLDYDGE